MNDLVLPRRGLILGLTGLFAAPSLIKIDNLMKVVTFDKGVRISWDGVNNEEINALIETIRKLYPQIVAYDLVDTYVPTLRIKGWAKPGERPRDPDIMLDLKKEN